MKYPRYKILLAFVDLVLVLLAYTAAVQLRGIVNVSIETLWNYIQSPNFIFFLLYSFFIIVLFQSNSLYKIDIVLTKSKQVVGIFNSFFYAVIGLAVINYLNHSLWIMDSRLAVLYFSIIGFFSIVGYRLFLFRPFYMFLGRKQIMRKNILIIGTNLEARYFAIQLSVDNIYGLNLVGFVDNLLPVGSKVFEKYDNLGRIDDIPSLVKMYDISEIIISISDVSYGQLLHVIDICKKSSAQVRVTSTLFEIIHKKVLPEAYFDIPLANLPNSGRSVGIRIVKRITDIVLSTVILLCLSPYLFFIALCIKLTSKGPVLYHQMRIGKDGKEFRMYKFRSMVLDSDADSDRVQKAKEFIQNGKHIGNGMTKIVNAVKITPIGRFIRKTSIDEIPQLFNVLKGDMSLTGPRPCLPYEYEVYDDWHKRRLSVLPGCTGLWQVSSRSEVGFDDMVLLDLYYIDNMSPWFDLQLMLKTIPVMVFGKGAL